MKGAVDQLIDATPAGVGTLAWVRQELASRALERQDGDLKEAAALLGADVAELRRILADSPLASADSPR